MNLSESYTEEQLDEIWVKGEPEQGYSPDRWRKDKCGASMNRSEHGNTDSPHGWEVDHIIPKSKGGSDHIDNLRPLHWKNNDAKGDKLDGYWECAKTS